MKRKRLLVFSLLGLLAISTPAWASLFGEENGTLAGILAELVDSGMTLADLSDTAPKIADCTEQALKWYSKINAAIDEVRHYSFSQFLDDLGHDVSHQYPGFAKLEYATENFGTWASTKSSSPFTAYEAISAVAADISQPLRDDLAAHRASIDKELILASESAEGFAAAQTVEDASAKLDDQIKNLAREAENASPGRAQQLAAQAEMISLAQQSHTMRLLARMVRMNSTNAALDFGTRISARNAAYQHEAAYQEMASQALKPVELMQFGDL